MTQRVVAIIQARLGSSRLPGKVLLTLGWQTVLQHVVARVSAATLVDGIVIATTDLSSDDPLAAATAATGARLFRGSEQDVLSRFAGAAAEASADAVVRITSDCPLMDPGVLDLVVGEYLSHASACDYASNTIVRTFPRGLDVEVFSRAALEAAALEAAAPDEREHVTPFIHHHPNRFRRRSVETDVDLSHHRWTLDTPEDFSFLKAVFEGVPIVEGPIPSYDRVSGFLDRHPDILALNAGVQQKPVMDASPSTSPLR